MDSTLWGIPYSDWRIYNSFAPWLSAIGTLLAVGLSLWLSMKKDSVNLKLIVTKIVRMNINKPSNAEEIDFVQFKIINNGFRAAHINSLNIQYAPNHNYELKNLLISNYKTTTPFKIDINEIRDYAVPLSTFLELKNHSSFKKLFFVVETIQGKRFTKKIEDKVLFKIKLVN